MAKKKSKAEDAENTEGVEGEEYADDFDGTETEDRPPTLPPSEEAPGEGAPPEGDPNSIVELGRAPVVTAEIAEKGRAVEAVKGDQAPMQPTGDPATRAATPMVPTPGLSIPITPAETPSARRATKGERTFIVAKGKVGQFSYGEKVRLSQFPKGTDIDRLMGLGALSEVGPS